MFMAKYSIFLLLPAEHRNCACCAAEVFMLAVAHGYGRLLIAAAVALATAGSAVAAGVEPLVTLRWLQLHHTSSDVVVLDIRSAIDGGGVDAYARGHIPG